jgi:predicted methyltransferase
MAKKKDEMKEFCKSADGAITYRTDGNFIFAETGKGTIRLDMFAGHYYKLRLVNGVPILEVDGLRMQLVKDFKTPLDYSKQVARGVSKGLKCQPPGEASVLDTCMGLGYTAIASANLPGVKMVVTCEVSDAVVTLAQWNPLSGPVFQKDGKIMMLKGSVAESIKGFAGGMFSAVVHDPPRFSHAPELYALDFYKELHRVCLPGARVFHYVGSVGKGKGRKIDKEVSDRLLQAGFRKIEYVEKLQGLFFSK